jgi:hypothetical protein
MWLGALVSGAWRVFAATASGRDNGANVSSYLTILATVTFEPRPGILSCCGTLRKPVSGVMACPERAVEQEAFSLQQMIGKPTSCERSVSRCAFLGKCQAWLLPRGRSRDQWCRFIVVWGVSLFSKKSRGCVRLPKKSRDRASDDMG